jgi:hypothetical protein
VEHPDAIAILLAARHDPAIQELADFQKAQALLETDALLQAAFAAEQTYYDEHEELLAQVRLPETARAFMRERIRAARADAQQTISWRGRVLALAAAAAILFVIGGIMLRPSPSGSQVVAETGGDLESLRAFAAGQVAQRALDLDQHSDQPAELFAWLQGQGAPVSDVVPASLQGLPTMGCKVYDWEGRHVALVCFRTASQQVVHLFIADRGVINIASAEKQAGLHRVHRRETVSWMDAEHAYVMVAHDEGQTLADLSG